MLTGMHLGSPILFAAVFGALAPDAPDRALTIVLQVTQLNKAGEHAHAAELAAAGAAREDLDHAERVGLAGLAAQSFELSYQAGGPLTDLCGLAAVMRLAAPLDTPEGGAVKRAEAEKAEARLERAAGAQWRTVCEPEPADAPVATAEQHQAPITAPKATTTSTPLPVPPPRQRWQLRDPRRIWAGVGTLLPGLLLFVPIAPVLARRDAAERALWTTLADVRRLTDAEREQAAALSARYRATTIGAGILGAAGAALAVTGVVLLATSRRPSRVSVTPWGGRGVGGLILEGRF